MNETLFLPLDLMTAETRSFIAFVMRTAVRPPILALGVVSNIINIIVFMRLGLKDSLSLSFFVLSCTDLTSILIMIPSDIFYLFTKEMMEMLKIDGDALGLILAYYYAFFYDLSQIITTFIAVQKCCCVALPLDFRNTVTRCRTFLVLAALALAYFSIYAPVMVSQGLRGSLGRETNSTVWIFWASDSWPQIYSARSTVAIILTTVCHVTVLVCLGILVSNLRASSRFRNSLLHMPTAARINECDIPIPEIAVRRATSKISPRLYSLKTLAASQKPKMKLASDVSEENSNKLVLPVIRQRKSASRVELQTVKSTTLVSVLFILCNTPKLLIFYAVLCQPEFNLGHRFTYTYLTANTFRFTVEALNASSNMFVYLKFNRRFRKTLRSC